jgi:hypothetical protein
MLSRLIQRIGVAGLAAMVGVALIGGAALAWTGHVEGQPSSFTAGGTDGYYVWHDGNGMHLRTTDSAGVFTYSGVLHTNGTFVSVNPVKLEADDKVEVLDGGKTIKFQFVTHTGVDGLDFEVSAGSKVRFTLSRDGNQIDPANIFLGTAAVHPHHSSFVLRREKGNHAGRGTRRVTPSVTATPTS